MQIGSGRATGLAHPRDDLALANLFTDFYQVLAVVRVTGRVAVAVIDFDHDPVAVAIARPRDDAVGDVSYLLLEVIDEVVLASPGAALALLPADLPAEFGTAELAAAAGIVSCLGMIALISASIGMINLFPIPVLDGGHLLFFLAEAVKGAPLSEQFMIQGQRIGLMILLALMGLAFYVDLSRLLG